MWKAKERNVSYHASTRVWLAPRGTREGEKRGERRGSSLPWKGKVIFAWIGGRNFRPIPGLAHCRGSIDRPRHCERETHLPEARDAGEKGDGFKGGSLWDCRFNAVSDKPPPLLRTHPSSSSPLSSTRPCFGDALARGQATNVTIHGPSATVENSIFNFNDRFAQDVSWKGSFEEDA